MRNRSLVALIVVCVLLAVSLAALAKLYLDRRAAPGPPAVAEAGPWAQPGWVAPPGGAEAGPLPQWPGGPPAQPPVGTAPPGAQAEGVPPGPPGVAPGAPGGAGGQAGPSWLPFGQDAGRWAAGRGQRPSAAGERPAGGPSMPAPPSLPAGPVMPTMPTLPALPPGWAAGAGGAARIVPAAAPAGPGAPPFREAAPAPDPRLTEVLRSVARARERIEDAKIAIREHNQDQLVEILNEALALLPAGSVPGPAAPPAQQGRPSAVGPGPTGPGASAWLPGAGTMPAGPPDLLTEGHRLQEALFHAFELVRDLPPEQYEQVRWQLAMGLAAELLAAGGRPRPGAGLPVGEGQRPAPTGPPQGWPGGAG